MTARRKVGGSAPGERRGNAGRGRKQGVPNKTTTALKEAILHAAEATGEDGEGKGGLTGYLKHVARSDVKAFSSLLGKVLPMQVTGDGTAAINVIINKPE